MKMRNKQRKYEITYLHALDIGPTYHRQMGSEKFGGLQRLRSAYRDGRLEAVNEAWMEIDPDFGIDE